MIMLMILMIMKKKIIIDVSIAIIYCRHGFFILLTVTNTISFPESLFPWSAVGKERLWSNPKKRPYLIGC